MFKYAVILAAGKGERMKPLTDYIPKPLVKKNNYPLIEWAISSLPETCRTYVTYGHLGSKVLAEYSDFVAGFIRNNGDNAWWLKNSIFRKITEPIIVTPCDISYEIDWSELAEEAHSRKLPAMIVPVERMPEFEGDYISHKDGKITEISRIYSHDSDFSIMASGIQIIIPSLLKEYDVLHENFYDVWFSLINFNLLGISSVRPKVWGAVDRLDQL